MIRVKCDDEALMGMCDNEFCQSLIALGDFRYLDEDTLVVGCCDECCFEAAEQQRSRRKENVLT